MKDFLKKKRKCKKKICKIKNFDHNSRINDFRLPQYELLYNKTMKSGQEACLKELSNFLLNLLSQIVKNQISPDVSLQFFKEIKGMNILNTSMLVELIWIIGLFYLK